MVTEPNPPPPRDFLPFEAQMRCLIAAIAAIAAYFVFHLFASAPTCIIAAWDGFALTLLALLWFSILSSGIEGIRFRARNQDLSKLLIFIFTIAAACSSIFAVVALLSAAKNGNHVGLHAALSILAVLAAWTLVHTMFTLRYAHFYYGEGESPDQPVGGLEFPSDENPNYLDFAYFSFVIGMTCQVSDVQISSKSLRSLALVHGILSFCFNTVILALTINTLSGLL
jgi:uncharacterized membrane protein